jgi:hypothetical protein
MCHLVDFKRFFSVKTKKTTFKNSCFPFVFLRTASKNSYFTNQVNFQVRNQVNSLLKSGKLPEPNLDVVGVCPVPGKPVLFIWITESQLSPVGQG